MIHKWLTAIILFVSTGICAAAPVDPTRPLSYVAKPGTVSNQSLQLESILYSSNRKVAIINQAVLAEGDKLGSLKVTRITPTSVRVIQDGKAQTLVLPNTEIKTLTTDKQQDE